MSRKRDRLKAIPWALLLEAAMIVRNRWGRLTPGERDHVVALARKSRGRPQNLTGEDRQELRRLAAKLDLSGIAREAAPLGRRWRGRQRSSRP
jgi:hypothetical protein